MCGIAGVMRRDGREPTARMLDALGAALDHRGPDGRARYIRDNVGLVHTRLAVIDLKTGNQPFPQGVAARNAPAVLIANGEIYNYVEERERLRAIDPDIAFQTGSDCEVPLHLFHSDNENFVEHLRGMYGLAFHDAERGKLVLSRDPFGIKPLYYAETAEGFFFASEPKALTAAGLIRPAVNEDKRDEMFALQFSTGRETIFQNIERVLPGETIEVSRGQIIRRRRTPALPAGGPVRHSADEALARLDAVLHDSVRLHQRSDVPYAMFLSGGVDSSAILALMRDLNETPVHAFTAGFTGTRVHDERAHAEAVAKAAGAAFTPVDFTEADFWTSLPAIARAMDDPAADYAVLPSFKLAQAARAEGLKVILSGEGGDELFAGYGRYRRYMRPSLFGEKALRRKGTFDGLNILRRDNGIWRERMRDVQRLAMQPGRTRLQVAQAIDCADWLPHDLLGKLDRCLMAHGVEGRTPFLDREVARFACRLPDDMKVRGRMGKWLLRKWLNEKLPEADAFSKKRGFTVPVAHWIAGAGARLGPLVAAQPGVAEACDANRVEALFKSMKKRQGFAAWTLLFYALWHQIHIVGRAPGPDVFTTLETE